MILAAEARALPPARPARAAAYIRETCQRRRSSFARAASTMVLEQPARRVTAKFQCNAPTARVRTSMRHAMSRIDRDDDPFEDASRPEHDRTRPPSDAIVGPLPPLRRSAASSRRVLRVKAAAPTGADSASNMEGNLLALRTTQRFLLTPEGRCSSLPT